MHTFSVSSKTQHGHEHRYGHGHEHRYDNGVSYTLKRRKHIHNVIIHCHNCYDPVSYIVTL